MNISRSILLFSWLHVSSPGPSHSSGAGSEMDVPSRQASIRNISYLDHLLMSAAHSTRFLMRAFNRVLQHILISLSVKVHFPYNSLAKTPFSLAHRDIYQLPYQYHPTTISLHPPNLPTPLPQHPRQRSVIATTSFQISPQCISDLNRLPSPFLCFHPLARDMIINGEIEERR